MLKRIILSVICLILASCASRSPRDVQNICSIFRENPQWYTYTYDVQKRWLVPITVQMAIMHQESKFEADAQPPRRKLFWIIPWSRPSTAYGYAQALDGTWALYKQKQGRFWARRNNFKDGVDFIGWYANDAYKRAGIPRTNAYQLYLAYHEGVGGYMNKTYLRKPWLIVVAHKVSAREQIYRAQLSRCEKYFSQQMAHHW